MNLHGIAAGVVAAVNPPFTGSWVQNTGYTTAASGKRTETTTQVDGLSMQVQPLTMREIQHLDSLNIQGTLRAVHMNGVVQGLNRPSSKGGDVLLIPTGLTGTSYDTWLVVQVLEGWEADGWCRLAVSLQNPPQDQ